jgi:hypothetical protein
MRYTANYKNFSDIPPEQLDLLNSLVKVIDDEMPHVKLIDIPTGKIAEIRKSLPDWIIAKVVKYKTCNRNKDKNAFI